MGISNSGDGDGEEEEGCFCCVFIKFVLACCVLIMFCVVFGLFIFNMLLFVCCGISFHLFDW